MRHTPFHPRTAALCHSLAWKEWAGYAAVCNYDRHSEREYVAFRYTAGLIDVTPLYKLDVKGPDAGKLLSRVWTRDISKISVGRVVYSALCDEHGWCLDDGTIARLGPEHYRMSSSEPWYRWLHRWSRGLDVQIEDTSQRIAVLSLQGPMARKILEPIVEFDMNRMRFFRVRRTTLAGHPVWISRTGYTGDLGYEIWMDNEDALGVWDSLLQAGRVFGIEPAGLDAMDFTRIEAGFVLQGVDYVTAKACITKSLLSTPEDAGLGWTVELERDPFVGQAALSSERERGPKWELVGLEFDWPELERLYDAYGLPPHLAPSACRSSVPLYDPTGRRQVGQVTSSVWSPVLKRYLALGQVHREWGATDTPLRVEHTPEFERRQVTARVVDKPFFDPERKRSVPAKAKAGAA